MFNFLKKENNNQSEVVEEQPQVIDSKHIQNDINKTFTSVLEEFDLKISRESHIENLKSKINKFKEENKEVYDKIEKLKSVGFVNTPSVKKRLQTLEKNEAEMKQKIENINSEIKKSEELQRMVKEYSLKYPSYKFVNTETMIKIMKKYDLFLGDAFMYTKEIPNKSLDIISGFADEINESKTITQLVAEQSSMSSYVRYSFREKPKPVKVPSPDDEAFNSYRAMIELEASMRYSGMHIRTIVEDEFPISKLKMIAPLSHFEIPYRTEYRSDGREVHIPVVEIDTNTNMFRFTTNKLNEHVKKHRPVLDPIACLEVDGGYIILDAWDKEADIPEIKNPNLN